MLHCANGPRQAEACSTRLDACGGLSEYCLRYDAYSDRGAAMAGRNGLMRYSLRIACDGSRRSSTSVGMTVASANADRIVHGTAVPTAYRSVNMPGASVAATPHENSTAAR